MFSIGIVGAGQFAGAFAKLFNAHPGVSRVTVTDLLPERSATLVGELGLAGVEDDFDAMLASDVDAVAIFTQRWTHGPLVVRSLRAGKHVYSAVPMAFTVEEIAAIIEAVKETGLTYMMGETSQYNPTTVLARQKAAEGAFGRLFYAEGDYVHDMDHGFYAAYQYSGGAEWKRTASFPPMKYPTHAIGGVLGAWNTHAVSVSAVGRGRSARRRRLRQVREHVRQRLLQRHRPVRDRRRRQLRAPTSSAASASATGFPSPGSPSTAPKASSSRTRAPPLARARASPSTTSPSCSSPCGRAAPTTPSSPMSTRPCTTPSSPGTRPSTTSPRSPSSSKASATATWAATSSSRTTS